MYLRGSFNTRKSNMDNNKLKNPAYLFEVSWEVCNKVGGIHTVISTKALNMEKEYSSSHILIGPDVWRYTEQNPEFIDDPRLFRSWRQRAAQEGLRIKVGRWNVAGKPIVILVDFSTFITQKDEIFASFWEKYKLDSISGQWDYIEPALFGYAAGKVIESFVRFNSSIRQRIIAQFHEWMTGAGLLYLKSAMPQVGCVFTTHATVLGRCVAGNNLPLYSEMKNYVPEAVGEEKLAFDHAQIILEGLMRLRNKAEYSDVVFNLMAKEFTLPDLQRVYEIILGKKLYKANFRDKIVDKVMLLDKKGISITGRKSSALYRYNGGLV